MNKETIRKAIELIRDHHSKKLFVREREGEKCYCMIGAVLVAGGTPVGINEKEEGKINLFLDVSSSTLVSRAQEAAKALGFKDCSEAYNFNDSHSEEEVIARMEAALNG